MYEGLTSNQLGQLLQTAVDAAHVAAVPIRAYFEKQDLHIREKSDGSPVTQADQEGEGLIRSYLLSHTPIGPLDILGEEEGLQGAGTRSRAHLCRSQGARDDLPRKNSSST
ncbi:MAG: hypothetical protein P8X46_09110 [Nitrospirales bacterium]